MISTLVLSHPTTVAVAVWLLTWADPVPEAEDVKAGWTAFGLFGLGVLAVALLGVSLTRHLRRADQSEADGLFDPSDRPRPRPQPRDQGPKPQSGTTSQG